MNVQNLMSIAKLEIGGCYGILKCKQIQLFVSPLLNFIAIFLRMTDSIVPRLGGTISSVKLSIIVIEKIKTVLESSQFAASHDIKKSFFGFRPLGGFCKHQSHLISTPIIA